jgi:hypothetical protein
LDGLAIEDVGIFYGQKFYFMYSHFGMLYGHLVYFVVIWYIFPSFDMLYQEKSGNPAFLALMQRHASPDVTPLSTVSLKRRCQRIPKSPPTTS